ncbi:hypothetical protein CDL12_15199 [Handroanthus impetiginosus]|uniref:Uncharacterized protein n=1 Tax=Handroanthus impetiginosus TaxID=429701 RepID=A0A2G9H3X0_9LAMI|nr:hypothetical protein CDL12_15199 [Handroanthus impetiginosus]
MDAMLILPVLLKLENLEVSSLAGIQTIYEEFVSEFVSVHGCRMKELVLADCMWVSTLILYLATVESSLPLQHWFPGQEAICSFSMEVSNPIALSLARNCRNLRSLGLSRCRNLMNEALGLIVDSCSLLEVAKSSGCTQDTNVFVDGHSNPPVKLIGLKMIDVPDFLLGPL